jgi:PAS domain S-box-containing protein
MKNRQKYALFNSQQMLMLSLFIIILIISAAYLYYRYEKKIIRQEQYSNLNTIADLKIGQIMRWRQDRLADAHVIAESPFIRQNFQRWLLSKDSTLGKDLLKRFSLLRFNYKYEDVFIVSAGGKLLLGLDTNLKKIDSVTIDFCKKALQDRKTCFSDFYFCSTHNTIHFDIIAPILNDRNIPFAVLVLRVNPYDYLYPLIQSWPTSSKSAETLIIRKEDDSVLYLNELRHISKTPLKLRIPLTSIQIPAVQAVLGQVGICEGIDYRGVKVLADRRPIPGSPWFMIAKVDQSEIFSELYYRVAIIIIVTLSLLLLLGIGVSWLYNNRQKNIYRKLLESGTALQQSKEEFRTTLYSIGDAVITTDIKGFIRNMNVVAEKLTGWTESDAFGISLGEVFHIVNEESHDKVENPVQRVLKEGLVAGLTNHSLLISKEGKEIPIADSGAPIRNEKGEITGVVLVFHDQSQERMALKSLQESERKFRETVKYLDEGYYSVTIEGLLLDHNQAFNRILGIDIDQDLKGAKLPDFWQNPDERKVYLDELITRGFIKNYLINAKTIGGKKIVVLANSHLVKDESGGLVRIEGTYTDFTELKRIEEALEDERNLLRTLIDLLPTLIFVKDSESRFLVANVACARFMGATSPQELIGKTDNEFYEVEAAAGFRSDELSVLEGIPLVDKEEGGASPSGNPRNLLTTKVPLRDVEGNIIGLVGASFDITERKQVEETNRILARFPSENPGPVMRVERNGRLLYANEASYRLLTWKLKIGAKIPSDLQKEIVEVLTGGIIKVIDTEHYQRVISFNIVPFVEAGYVNLYGRDITERIQAEEALKESERKLREAQEMAHLGFWNWDIKTGDVEWSEEVFKIFGLDPKKFIPHIDSILALSPWPEDNQRDKELINRAIETHRPGSYEQKFLRPDQSIGHYYSTFQGNYNEEGNLISIVGTVLDITQRKQTEEAIQMLNKELEQRVIERTAQLEVANQELEAFSYSVSHDLRAPLRAVDGFSKFVLEDYGNKLDSEGNRMLGLIRTNTQKMDQLITDLLNLSRVSRRSLQYSDIDMTQMAISMFNETAPDYLKNNLKLIVDKLPEAFADPVFIKQVWINFLSNAIKFTSKKKKAEIRISGKIEDLAITYSIKDNGAGFNQQYVHKLFGVFQRLHKSEDFEGTGVGLAIVQRIIHRHGGKVWAESEEGKGATFYFSLPVKNSG